LGCGEIGLPVEALKARPAVRRRTNGKNGKNGKFLVLSF
jgi:hypothetical protein